MKYQFSQGEGINNNIFFEGGVRGGLKYKLWEGGGGKGSIWEGKGANILYHFEEKG